ncbi:MAG: autotransporter domain-containing protein [Rhizobiales bacterium]|nr:autotransporter domain-containing protein [Hyphomicrobiales bacterium]
MQDASSSALPQPLLFATAELGSPAEALARFRALTADICDVTVSGEPEDFRVATSTWHLGNAVLFESRSSALRYDRTPAHVARGIDHFQLSLHVAGGAEFAGGHGMSTQRPGDICLIDMTRPSQTRVMTAEDGSARLLTFMLPRMLLASLFGAQRTIPALYGGGQWGGLGIRLGAASTWHQLDISRTIAFSGFGDRLTARYQARTTQVFGEIGYRLDMAAVALEPFVNLAAVRLDTDAFREAGGAAALGASAGSMATSYVTSGLRAATRFVLADSIVLTARGTLGWRHAFGDVRPEATLAFAGGSPFSVAGQPIARDALVIEAGLDMTLGRAVTVGISYGGQIARGVTDHGLKGNLVWKF